MVPEKLALGLDPEGGNRFSDGIMRKITQYLGAAGMLPIFAHHEIRSLPIDTIALISRRSGLLN